MGACAVGVVVGILGYGCIQIPCYYEELRWGDSGNSSVQLLPELLFGVFCVFVVGCIGCNDVQWGFCGLEGGCEKSA